MIQNSLESGEIAVCAFLDILGTFDNTSHVAITNWMSEMLATRSVETAVGSGTERWCTVDQDHCCTIHKNLISGEFIEFKQEVKFLRITLDHKLLWNRHIQETASKDTSALMVCRSLAGKTWGCNPSILRWMYTSMIRPIITYGAAGW